MPVSRKVIAYELKIAECAIDAHSTRIGKHNRIVVAVSEEIVALQAAVGAEDGIRAEEPADVGVVVSGVQIVPAGLYVVVIAPVSERVDVGDVGCVGGHIVARAIGDLEILPPSVVGVDCTTLPYEFSIRTTSPCIFF